MGYVFLLAVVGLSLFGAVYLLARLRKETERAAERLPDSIVQVNLLDNDDAILVAEGRGRLVFANPKARTWFGLNGGEPDLELMADAVQPADTFLELFSKEGQASFRIGTRRVEATSHYIPRPEQAQMVVVLRELAAASYTPSMLDPVKAMTVASEIAAIVSAQYRMDEMLDAILTAIGTAIPYDVAEITLWDEDLQILRSKGRVGESSYFEAFDSTDGVYHLDDSYSGWVARYRQPLLIADTRLRLDVRAKLSDYPFQSFIAVPLMVGERFIGTLELASRSRVAFDHEDMALLQAVAGPTAIAIENARLHESQTERVAELSGLQQIAGAMTLIRDRRQMYAQLTGRIAVLMNVEMCGLLLYDPSQEALVGQPPFHGVPDAIVAMYRVPMPLGSMARTIYDSGEWWYSNNVRADDIVQQTGLSSLAEAVGVRTTAVVRLAVGERSFGVIQVANKRDGSGFGENDLRLLNVFASQVAIVVENARLYEEEQARTGEIAGLQEVSQAVGRLRNANDLYTHVNERIAKLMRVQMSGILLYDEAEGLLVSRPPFYGIEPELVRHYTIGVAPGGAFHRIFTGQDHWISNELRADPILRESGLDKLAMLVGMRQTMMVPLILGGRRLGALQVSNRLDGRDFTEADARVLSVFAAQVAVIIDNARLQHETITLADRAARLHRIAETVSSSAGLDSIIGQVVLDTARLLEADICSVALLDERSGSLTIRPEWTVGLEDLKEPYTIDTFAPGFQSSVVVSRRPFMSNNLRADARLLPVYRSLIERFNFNVAIQAPLAVREQGIGELSAGRRGDRPFTDEDLRLLASIGEQLAAAVDRHRLQQITDADVRARIQELDAVTRISAELNRTTEFSRILEVIRQQAEKTTGADGATIVLLRPHEEWQGTSEPEVERRLGGDPAMTGLAGVERRALYQRMLVSVEDYAVSDFAPQPADARAAIAAPVVYSEQLIGLVHIYASQPGRFSVQTEDFIKTLVSQVAIAYGNETRYQEQLERANLLVQRNEQLIQIFELGRMLRSGEPIEEILEAVAHGISDAVGFNVVVISLIDRAAGVTRRVAQSGLPLLDWEEARKSTRPLAFLEEKLLLPRYQISSSYFLPGEEVSSITPEESPFTYSPPSLLHAGTGPRAWTPEDLLLVPLISSTGERIGLISVDAPRDGMRPTRRTIEALETFASQAAFAIENYQLVGAYQEQAIAARRERDRLEQMHLVASEIQRAPDVPSRLQVVADGIQTAGWGRVAITLRGPDYEPQEMITAGYSAEEAALLRQHTVSGVVWRERLADPEFRRYRIGQAYYIRHSDPWVTENKLIAGADEDATEPGTASSEWWHPLDTLYLPLYGLDQSRLIGIISMDSPENGRPPSEAELRPIELFAAQAAFAIENTRLYQGMINAAQQEARINEVTEAITATLDLDAIIQGVAGGFHQMIAFTRMSVGLLQEQPHAFAMRDVSVGPQGEITPESGGEIDFESSAMGAAVQEALTRVYDLTDPEQVADFADLKHWRERGERTALVVPMISGGRVIGALSMGSTLAEAFGFETQLPLVARIANLTAVAIENAQLFQQTIERERFSSALSRVGQSVNTMLDMGNVLNTVCEESISILNVAGAYVWVVDGEELVGVAARGPGADQFPGVRVRLDEADILGSVVIRDRVPATVNAAEPGDQTTDTPQGTVMIRTLPGVPVQSVLGVPLIREDRAIGAIAFIQTSPRQFFTEMDIEQASAFAAQAAIALENARLYQETLGLQSFNEAIIQSIQQGIVVLDAARNIRTVNSYMRRVYGWTDEAIGQSLFSYRPHYQTFLQTAVDQVLQSGAPESRHGIRETSPDSRAAVRNFYVYPLLEGETINGCVILVEDVTARAALEADVARRERQLTVLTEISTQLTAMLDPEAVIRVMFDQLERILEYDCATLWIAESDKLIIEAARGYANADALIGIEAEIADSELFRDLAARGQVLNIPDITQDRRFPPPGDDHPMRSWLGVSLVSRGKLAGLLVLEKGQVGYYTPTMEQLALTFANQVAVALENADLFQKTIQAADENTRLYRETAARARELDQQAQRLALLYRVSNALTQSLDLEDVFEVALRETIDALGLDSGCAFLIESDRTDLRPVITYPRGSQPPSEEETVVLADNRILDQMRRALQPIAIRDVLADPRLSGRTPGGGQALSSLLVPLNVSGQLIGMLEFNSVNEYRDLTPEQIEVAQTIASQAAIAVQNANLLEQSLARTRELELLFDATQSISATMELSTVLESIAQQMIIAMQVDGCQITNWDVFEDCLKVSVDIATGSPVTTDPPGTIYDLAAHPTRARALHNRQVILIRRDDPGLPDPERLMLERRGVHSRILIPMHVREQAIGLIELDICNAGRAFTGGEVRLARTLSAQAAVAIENAGLQTETASKLEELFVINDLSTALAANIEPEGVFEIVRTRLPSLIRAQWLVLAVVDPDSGAVTYPVALRDGEPVTIESDVRGDDEIAFVIRQTAPQRLVGDEIAEVLRNAGARLRIIPARCLMGVPMIAGEQPLGALVIGDEHNLRAFTLNDQRILSTVGAQIAVALQNARLFARTRRFAADLERAVEQRTAELQRERDSITFLYQLTANLTSSLDIDVTLNRALVMMSDAVGADMGAILGIDSLSDSLIFRAGYNLPVQERQGAGLSPREGLAGWVIQTQQSVMVPDVQQDYRWMHMGAWDDEPRAAIAALLEANEETLGVVMLYRTSPDPFDEDQLLLVEAAAKQIASAMNNADLYALIREQAERLGAMVRREQVESTKSLAIVESIADGVMVANQDGEIIQFNSAAERILGLSRRQVIGSHISTLAGLYSATGGQGWLAAIERWTAHPDELASGSNGGRGDMPDGEHELRAEMSLDNGRHISVILSPVNIGDQFLGTVSVIRDITREIEVDRMKSEFVATVSHELRTPMTSIKGYADLLLLGAAGQVTEQQQHFLSTIKANADRLSVLVNELLDISRLDRGAVKLNLQPINVADVVEVSLRQLHERIQNEGKAVEVSSDIPEDLPLMRADFDKMTQVMNHLLNNAYNYTHADGRISVVARMDADAVLLTVADTGIGIPAEKQDRIWTRFFRDEEQPLVMETSGAGLGLSIVKEYVEMHRGTIWLESEAGQGTTFFIRIPAFTSASA